MLRLGFFPTPMRLSRLSGYFFPHFFLRILFSGSICLQGCLLRHHTIIVVSSISNRASFKLAKTSMIYPSWLFIYCKKTSLHKLKHFDAFLFQTYQHFFLTTFEKTSTFRLTFATEMNTFGICLGRLMRKCEKNIVAETSQASFSVVRQDDT